MASWSVVPLQFVNVVIPDFGVGFHKLTLLYARFASLLRLSQLVRGHIMRLGRVGCRAPAIATMLRSVRNLAVPLAPSRAATFAAAADSPSARRRSARLVIAVT